MHRDPAAADPVATACKQIRLRVILWFLFGVLVSLITVGLSWHSRWIAGESAAGRPTFPTAIGGWEFPVQPSCLGNC